MADEEFYKIKSQEILQKFIREEFKKAVEEIKSLQKDDPDELLTTKEAIKELKVCRQTLIKMRDRGEIRAVFRGNRPRYRRGDLNPYKNKK